MIKFLSIDNSLENDHCDCGGAHVDVEAPRQGPRLTLGSLPKASGLGNLTRNTQIFHASKGIWS